VAKSKTATRAPIAKTKVSARTQPARRDAAIHDLTLPLSFRSWPALATFLTLCALLLAGPVLLSGFWPTTYDYTAQSLFGAVTACACLLMALRPREPRNAGRKLSPVITLLVAFFGWLVLSSAATVYWHDTLLELARVGIALAWFFIARALLREDAHVWHEQVEWGDADASRIVSVRQLCVVGAVVIGTAFVCWPAIVDFLRTRDPRQFSTFYNPNLFANYCAMALPLNLAFAIGLWRTTRNGQTGRIKLNSPLFPVLVSAALTLIVAMGLVVTSSKGGFLAALVALLVFAAAVVRARTALLRHILRTHRALVLGAVLLLLCGGGVIASKTVVPRLMAAQTTDANSTMFRAYTWRGTMDMIKARPVLGWGAGSFPSAYTRFAVTGYTRSAHQLWLQIAAENGLPALLLLLGVCMVAAVQSWRALKTEYWPWAAGGLGLLAAFVTHGLTDAGWGVTSITLLFMVVLALLDTTNTEQERQNASGRVHDSSLVAHHSSLRWSWLAATLLFAIVSWGQQRAVLAEDLRRESRTLMAEGKPWMALQMARQAAATDPLSARMWLNLAAAQEYNGEGNTASSSSYERAIRVRPTSAQAWLQWAQSRVRLERYSAPSPAPLFDRAVTLDPNDTSMRLARGQWLLSHSNQRGWQDLEYIARLADAPYGKYPAVQESVNLDFARAYMKLAERALQTGDKAGALKLLERPAADVARARAYEERQRQLAESVAGSSVDIAPPENLDDLEAQLNSLKEQAR
jgi:O-antigen ligase